MPRFIYCQNCGQSRQVNLGTVAHAPCFFCRGPMASMPLTKPAKMRARTVVLFALAYLTLSVLAVLAAIYIFGDSW